MVDLIVLFQRTLCKQFQNRSCIGGQAEVAERSVPLAADRLYLPRRDERFLRNSHRATRPP